MNTSPTTEDRTWASLSHLSSLAFGMGILLPIVGWSGQRRKSNYAAFQCLQALGYQSLGFTVWILSFLLIGVVAAIVLLVLSGSGSAIPPGWGIFFSILLLLCFAVYVLVPVVAALACALGKDFRYPFMGSRLARYLAYDPASTSEEPCWLIEDHEYRWVAAAGHFSVLIMIWGMLAPLTAWMLAGKRNFFLRWQSLQTLVYQAGVTVLYFVGAALYVAGLLGLILSMGGIGQLESSSSPSVVGLVVSAIILLLGGLIMLVIPLLHILGQWAGYRILKGDDYRYPLVGRLVEQRMGKPQPSKLVD